MKAGEEIFSLLGVLQKSSYEKMKGSFGNIDEAKFFNELYVLNLWTVSKMLSSEKEALDYANDKFISERNTILMNPEHIDFTVEGTQKWVLHRFKDYYDSWNEKEITKQAKFNSKVFENLLGQKLEDVTISSPSASLMLTLHVPIIMKSVVQYRKECPSIS